MSALTREQVRAYVKESRGGRCPYCGGMQIEGGHIAVEDGFCGQPVGCNDCGKSWEDVYELVGVTPDPTRSDTHPSTIYADEDGPIDDPGPMPREIEIEISGGVLVDVRGMPEGMTYKLLDRDDEAAEEEAA